MSVLLVAQVVASCLYAGFQWTVRIVVYPQFAGVDPGRFAAYERAHQQRISRVVGPLFAALVVLGALLLVRRPSDVPLWASLVGDALVAGILLVTWLGAVPEHRQLSAGWDQAAVARLLRVDSVRVLAATAAAALWVCLALAA